MFSIFLNLDVSKLETSTEVSEVQLAKNPSIVLTFLVSKLETSIEANLEHPINTLCITSTLAVLRPLRFTDFNEEHLAKRYYMFFMLFVFQVDKSILSKLEQPINTEFIFSMFSVLKFLTSKVFNEEQPANMYSI